MWHSTIQRQHLPRLDVCCRRLTNTEEDDNRGENQIQDGHLNEIDEVNVMTNLVPSVQSTKVSNEKSNETLVLPGPSSCSQNIFQRTNLDLSIEEISPMPKVAEIVRRKRKIW